MEIVRNQIILITIGKNVQNFLIFGIYYDAVILLTAEISFEFIYGKNFRKFLRFLVEAVEIAYGSDGRHIEAAADFCCNQHAQHDWPIQFPRVTDQSAEYSLIHHYAVHENHCHNIQRCVIFIRAEITRLVHKYTQIVHSLYLSRDKKNGGKHPRRGGPRPLSQPKLVILAPLTYSMYRIA